MKLTMKRGDTRSFSFRMSKGFYEPGQTVAFTAKPFYDNDSTNASAVINKTFTDDNILSQTDTDVIYEIKLESVDTENIEIKLKKGKGVLKLIGELEVRQPNGRVKTFPSGPNYLEVIIYPDAKIGA